MDRRLGIPHFEETPNGLRRVNFNNRHWQPTPRERHNRPNFVSDYWHYLTHPSTMDFDLRIADNFAKGVVTGAVITTVVVVGAPVAASSMSSGLTLIGMESAKATTIGYGTVSGGLLVGSVAGAYGFAFHTWAAYRDGDYDQIAFNGGLLTGGMIIGGNGGGRYLAELRQPSPAPKTLNPFTLGRYEWANRYRPSLGPPSLAYFATMPTPTSGAASGSLFSGLPLLVAWAQSVLTQ